jgi:hypothetical protein
MIAKGCVVDHGRIYLGEMIDCDFGEFKKLLGYRGALANFSFMLQSNIRAGVGPENVSSIIFVKL